ncbi:hypothetical protein H5P28_02110 [Ruficoccus amylovorans]|uniref:Uncharacterized protein n=1 Tax=Ruficoccus amylovorans TaxID=1804625 RepID=A0A842H9S5_9BACT|nr:hypothetical protein [Ruficoccus amylovorans]MBC2593045.1 hypothetical protein [Ruficoccus amylovorans]
MNPYLEIIDLEGAYNGQSVKLGWRGGILGDYLLGDLLDADGETVIQEGVTAGTSLIGSTADFTGANIKTAFQAELGLLPQD